MSNDWTNKLRDHLADYQEPVKDDLWAAIEQSLAQQEKTTKQQSLKPAREVILRRFSMAAAIAALAIGGTYVYLHPWNQAEKEIAATSVSQKMDDAAASQNTGDVSALREGSVALASQEDALASQAQSQNHQATSTTFYAHSSQKNEKGNELALLSDQAFLATEATAVLPNDMATASSDEKATISPDKDAVVSDKPLAKKLPSESAARNAQTKANPNYDLAMNANETALGSSRRSHSGSGWSMTVYGENGVAQKNNNNGNPYLMSDAAVANSPAYFGEKVFMSSPLMQNQLKAIGNMDYTDEVKHHHPISAGVQVGYNLTKRLRLTTGVVYTYTSSDFIGASRGSRVESTQKLHYLGIPLNLNYGVWKANRFHTYVTVGGEGDVNIKNHTETDGVETSSKRDRMQWSVNAAVGAQYDFMPQLGIYVEPGAKYYFDNGSQIENAFKDKKFNFNLQLGLRWNINH